MLNNILPTGALEPDLGPQFLLEDESFDIDAAETAESAGDTAAAPGVEIDPLASTRALTSYFNAVR